MFPEHITQLATGVLAEARSKKLTVATAESCTGGLIAGALTAIPGSSDVVDRGFVVYTNQAKTDLLGVPAAMIAELGAVSQEVAIAMAQGALAHSQASLSVACTGIAGPGGGSAEKPVGLVFLAAARNDGTLLEWECRFGDIGRDTIRARTVEESLKLLFQLM